MTYPTIDAVAAALDSHLDPMSPAPLVLGFSGGSDSLALLLCARAWALSHGRPLLALTIDHQLQPDSPAWTARAGAAARALDVPWRALSWRGPKPSTGLPAAARRARHSLLAEAARAAGSKVLMLGHTADDAAESDLIRRDTPSHGRLATWSPSPIWPEGRGVFLLRPLLDLRRHDLRSWLAAQHLDWLDDPANMDPRFARSRARATLAQSPRKAWPRCGAPAPPTERCDATGLAKLHPCGAMDLDARSLIERAAIDRLAKALVCVSGGEAPPRRAALERVCTRIEAGVSFTSTLAGARLRLDAPGLHLSRELGRAPRRVALSTDHTNVVFDGRFELSAPAEGWRVQALAGHMGALSKCDRSALRVVHAASRPGLPVLLGPEGQAELPAPFGGGPSCARMLIGERLAAAWGLVASERDLKAPPFA